MEKEVLENYKRYIERKKLYQSFGFDIDRERKFVLERAEPVFGDILEVGTGKGHFTLTLAKEGYRFISVDISEKEQKIAKLNLKYFGLENFVDFKTENAENLSFEDSSFDIIFSINTIHHLSRPIKVIDELIRIVTFEGKIIMSDFTKEGLEIIAKIHTSEGRIHEVGRMATSDISSYLESKGFNIQKHKSRFQDVFIVHRQII